jgi:hypothetical protein
LLLLLLYAHTRRICRLIYVHQSNMQNKSLSFCSSAPVIKRAVVVVHMNT